MDRNDFTGILPGYTATDQNIVYLDFDSGIVKQSHHATFDEAWYLQSAPPPAAQLLYDLGLKADAVATLPSGTVDELLLMPGCTSGSASVPWPPSLAQGKMTSKWDVPAHSRMLPLPLWEMALPRPILAAAACVWVPVTPDTTIASEFNITKDDMATAYMSPDPFLIFSRRNWIFENGLLINITPPASLWLSIMAGYTSKA